MSAQVVEEKVREADEAGERAELEKRRRALSPEALAGDSAAIADLEQVETTLAALDRRTELRALAEAEQAERDRVAAEAEAERQREAWRAEQAKRETARDAALDTFEKTLTKALNAARAALDANLAAAVLQSSIEPGSFYRRLNRDLEVRLLRRVHTELGAYGIKPDVLWGREGVEPLVAPAPGACVICARDDVSEIDAALAGGETLVAAAGRFGVARSTLGRHRGHASV